MNRVFGKFYKYRPIGPVDSKSRKMLRQIIVENQIYFAKPSTLNDPHDCRPATTAPSVTEVRNAARKMTSRVNKRHGLKLTENEKHSKETEIVLRLTGPKRRNEYLFDTLDKNAGVFCTSATPKSSPQWAYYADSHKGVCLEFTIARENPIVAKKVSYVERRPLIDIVRLLEDDDYREKQITLAVTTKSISWKEEHEIRFLNSEQGLYNYVPSVLTGILFGLNTPECYQQFVIDLVREANIRPKIQKCRLDDVSYDLFFDAISF